MLDKIIKFADRYDMFPSSGVVLACVSGGADSMALLVAMLEIAQKRGFTVSAAHYNHMLRGGESRRDEAFVREYCLARGVPFYAGSGDVGAYASEHGLSIEEAARDMRYCFFYSAAEKIGAARIATGHTADDNIETMIMNLARGAGATGLSGIPPTREIHNSQFTIHNSGVSNPAYLSSSNPYPLSPSPCADLPRIIRPLLRISRGEILEFTAERGIPFVEDSTNSLDVYTRNKVRGKVIPVLKEINPKYTEAAAAAAEFLRADDEYLSALADAFIREHCEAGGVVASVAINELLALPFAVSSRAIRKLCGGNVSRNNVKAVLELCNNERPSAKLSLPGMTVFREYGYLVFNRGGGAAARSVECGVWSVELGSAGADGFAPIYPKEGDCVEIPGIGLELSCICVECSDILHIFNKSVTSFLLKKDDICGIITVRPRREGDKIKLFGQNGTKRLKKLFIELRIPLRKRSLVPVIADDAGVLAIYGVGVGDRAVPGVGDEAILIKFSTVSNVL